MWTSGFSLKSTCNTLTFVKDRNELFAFVHYKSAFKKCGKFNTLFLKMKKDGRSTKEYKRDIPHEQIGVSVDILCSLDITVMLLQQSLQKRYGFWHHWWGGSGHCLVKSWQPWEWLSKEMFHKATMTVCCKNNWKHSLSFDCEQNRWYNKIVNFLYKFYLQSSVVLKVLMQIQGHSYHHTPSLTSKCFSIFCCGDILQIRIGSL